MNLINSRINMIKEGRNEHFVTELQTGYVVFCDHQTFKGYALFLCKRKASELHELGAVFKKKFLYEMSVVAEAVHTVFKPDKLNYELLGNAEPHLHWHIIPRYLNDPAWGHPIWRLSKARRESILFDEVSMEPMKLKLKETIYKLLKIS
jgi:diadenosine tetraphosphate (Ap4A) HIT family hydrolase